MVAKRAFRSVTESYIQRKVAEAKGKGLKRFINLLPVCHSRQ